MLLQDTRYTAYGLYACMVHEFGHLLLMQALGIKTESLQFYAAGIKLRMKDSRILSFRKELLILFGGCAINFAVFCVFWALSGKNTQMMIFAAVNLLIGLFNLMPIKGFDGERISNLLIERFCSIEKILLVKNLVRFFCALLLGAVLVYFFMQKSRNLSLYFTLLYFLVSSLFI